jgi:hypothetical protein
MTPSVIVNDIGTVSLRTMFNAILVLLVVAIVGSIIFRYGRKTFQTIYREPGQCAPDDYYAYKDPNIHADC